MEITIKKFDAAGKSRKWKEKIAAETNSMSTEDVLRQAPRHHWHCCPKSGPGYFFSMKTVVPAIR